MMWQGTAGNDVFDATRRIDINSTNLPSWMLGRWTGPGTSDKYPLFIVGDSSDNWKSSGERDCRSGDVTRIVLT